MKKWLFGIVVFGISFAAEADCYCACVNGIARPLCSNSLDIPPLCGAQLCPLPPPSIAPIPTPQVPPIGTSRCVPQQVYDYAIRRYVWREVCY
jgi:hypothetical protein